MQSIDKQRRNSFQFRLFVVSSWGRCEILSRAITTVSHGQVAGALYLSFLSESVNFPRHLSIRPLPEC